MLKRAVVVCVALSMPLVAAGAAPAEAPGKEAKAVAQAMVTRFVDSWNRADGAAYGENYWPDAELVDPSGAIIAGRDAIVKAHVDLWAGPFKGSHIAAVVRRIKMLGANYMVVDFDVTLSGVRQLPPGSPPNANSVLRNHLKHILEKRHGVWKVIEAQNTFIAAE